MPWRPTAILTAALPAILLLAGGCVSMTPGRMERVQPYSDRPRAGNVYLLRGWIGIFSYGINDLGEKLSNSGIRSSVYQDDQWAALADTIASKYKGITDPEPLILVGHSFGADDVLRVARKLETAGVKVDLVVTLDPVTPPQVPANVRRCFNLFQSNGAWDKVPAFRGVPLTNAEQGHGQVQNLDVRKDRTDLLEPGTDHFNIEKKGKIHQEVLRQVLATCPPRAQWAMGHAAPGVVEPRAMMASGASPRAPAPSSQPAGQVHTQAWMRPTADRSTD